MTNPSVSAIVWLMNHNGIGHRIEAGSNVSGNPDSSANTGEAAKQPVSLFSRAIEGVRLILSTSLVPLSERQIEEMLNEDGCRKIVRVEENIGTGEITEVYGDGRRVAVEPRNPSPSEMPEAPFQRVAEQPVVKPEA